MEAVFRGERPEVMPWFGDLTYWHAAHGTIGDLPERWRGFEGLLAMHCELNVGAYVPGCTGGDTIEGEGVRREVEMEVDGPRRVTRWVTPVGTVREIQEYCPDSFSWGYTEHAVKTAADLRVVRHIYERRRFEPHPERYPATDRQYAAWGSGPTHIGAPATPLSELNKHWVGVMELAYLMMDEPGEMARTLEAIARFHDEVYRHIAAGPRCFAMINENLSATTMGGYFDEHIAPHLRRWTGWLREAGHVSMIHNDGTLRGTLEKLAGAGVDAIDSVAPEPVGDVAIAELRAMAGERVILIGGLPGAMFAPPFTAQDIERQVREIVRAHKEEGRFVFGVADQVPPNGDLELVKRVGELVEEWGRY
jgi:hypothetical protein